MHAFLSCVDKMVNYIFFITLLWNNILLVCGFLELALSNKFLTAKYAEVRVHVHVPLPVGQTSWTSATQWRHEL